MLVSANNCKIPFPFTQIINLAMSEGQLPLPEWNTSWDLTYQMLPHEIQCMGLQNLNSKLKSQWNFLTST